MKWIKLMIECTIDKGKCLPIYGFIKSTGALIKWLRRKK